ncbi:hypothetical protein H310_08044 [Aphanomyces invadans]|uniref:Uncharacterized protein n=1 Tax=Aphanomyces invadans TaxID=157072 RepID=A0A024U123_9STRA|nr:hypothetical protein H310_08044 [Aphanomyces invadans]ETV99312.1 hypothetical protein H310_08044 [Aphanomyces invadans]|eukprot:XP_008871868.1 hypothetical protein H310_08044 [Aphanomyces invadans]
MEGICGQPEGRDEAPQRHNRPEMDRTLGDPVRNRRDHVVPCKLHATDEGDGIAGHVWIVHDVPDQRDEICHDVEQARHDEAAHAGRPVDHDDLGRLVGCQEAKRRHDGVQRHKHHEGRHGRVVDELMRDCKRFVRLARELDQVVSYHKVVASKPRKGLVESSVKPS